MADGIHRAVLSYIDDMLGPTGFNFGPEEKNAVSIMPDPNERVVKQWIRSSRREYGFQIIIVLPYSTEADSLNVAAAARAQAIYDEVEARNKRKEYPALPDGCTPESIELVRNMPELTGVNADQGLARYSVRVRLIYVKQEV